MRYYKNRREQHKELVEDERWEKLLKKIDFDDGYKVRKRHRQLRKAMLGII